MERAQSGWLSGPAGGEAGSWRVVAPGGFESVGGAGGEGAVGRGRGWLGGWLNFGLDSGIGWWGRREEGVDAMITTANHGPL
jgi:hypothetical protein